MKPIRRLQRFIGFGMILGICVLAIGILQPLPVYAILIPYTIDNFLGDFEDGEFRRAALYVNEGEPITEDGTPAHVRLTRVGALKEFDIPNIQLPHTLYSMGTVALNERIYVIGGRDDDGFVSTVNGGGADNGPEVTGITAQKCETPQGSTINGCPPVWSAVISDERDNNGYVRGNSLDGGWREELPLPQVEATTDNNKVVFYAPMLENMAVAAYDNPDPAEPDYIYVIGGVTRESTAANQTTVDSVWIGEVNPANGEIVDWTTSDDIEVTEGLSDADALMELPGLDWNPDATNFIGWPDRRQFGYQGMGAAVVEVDGTPYLYAFGGEVFNFSGGTTQPELRKRTFYAQIDPSDGRYYQPGTTDLGWALDRVGTSDDEVPTEGGSGRADMAVITTQDVDGEPVLWMFGGQNEPASVSAAQITAQVNRATFGSDGNIEWGTTPNQDVLTMDRAMYQHTVTEVANNVYIVGGVNDQGIATDRPTDLGYAGYVNDNLYFEDLIPDNPSDPVFFQGPLENEPDPLPTNDTTEFGLAEHGMVSFFKGGVQFVYIIGGRTARGAVNQFYMFRVFESSEEDIPFASSGWYISDAFFIDLDDARVEGITWYVDYGPGNNSNPGYLGMDVEMEYRGSQVVGPDQTCQTVDWDGADAQNWTPIPASTGDTPTTTTGVLVQTPDATGFSSQTNEYKTPYNGPDISTRQGQRVNWRCFQYRARLLANTAQLGNLGVRDISPELQRVEINVWTPNSPDVHILDDPTTEDIVEGMYPVWFIGEESGQPMEGYVADIFMQGVNLYYDENDVAQENSTLSTNVTKPAGWTFATRGDFADEWKDIFYIDMFIFGDGFNPRTSGDDTEAYAQQIQNLIPITNYEGETGTLISYTYGNSFQQYGYIKGGEEEDMALLPAENFILNSEYWCVPPLDLLCKQQPLGATGSEKISQIFPTSGDYTMCVAMDSAILPEDAGKQAIWDNYGYIEETLGGEYEAEENNVTCINLSVLVPPDITITPGDETLEINEGNTASFTISFDPAPGKDLTIPFEWQGQPDPGIDFRLYYNTVGSQEITDAFIDVPAGTSSLTIAVEAIQDNTGGTEFQNEFGEFILQSDPNGIEWELKSPASQPVLIFDPNGVEIRYEVNITSPTSPVDIVADEIETFTVSRDLSDTALQVRFETSGGAVRGTDYEIYRAGGDQPVGNNLFLDAGELQATFEVRSLVTEPGGTNKTAIIELTEDPTAYNLRGQTRAEFTLLAVGEDPEDPKDPEDDDPIIYLPFVAR